MKTLRGILIALAVLLVAVVIVFYLLGRGRVEEKPVVAGRTPGPDESVRLETVTLYFGDPERIALRRETRTLVTGPTMNDRLGVCIRELAAGSLTGGLPTLPPGTALRHAFVDRWGLAYLDFNRQLLGARAPGDGEEWLAVASIVRSVCDNFPEIREVRFMVDGEVVTSLGGVIDCEEPLRAEDFPDAGGAE
jgi:hypothetical protein